MAFTLLKQKNWFFIWLKGSIGVSFLVVACLLALLLYPMMGFKTLNGEITLANITVEKVAEQNFNLYVTMPREGTQKLTFSGDQWVITTMVLDWVSPLQLMGVQQGYLVADLSSSYLSVAQAEKFKSSKYALNEKNPAYRAWQYLEKYRRLLSFLKIKVVATSPTIFVDGAEYKVTYTKLGAKVRILNDGPPSDSEKEQAEHTMN